MALAGVVVAGLVAGLLVWQPWVTRAPSPVTAVGASSKNATSVTVSWTPPAGGTRPDRYLVSRDGRQVGQATDGETSYTDTGLAPGSTYYYTVIAASGDLRSQPAAKVKAVTLAPAPVDLSATSQTWSTVTFSWEPSPLGPAPGQYLVYAGPSLVATVPGTTTSYTLSGLSPGHGCQCTVVAKWGSAASSPSGALTMTALDPPLNGAVPVNVTTLSTPGAGASLKAGDHWADSWTFTPSCSGTTCTISADADLAAPGFKVTTFTVALHGSGSRYSGTTDAQVSTCGSVNVTNTITLDIAADNGGISHGAWTAWTGVMEVVLPYTVSGNEYCATQSWRFSVTPG